MDTRLSLRCFLLSHNKTDTFYGIRFVIAPIDNSFPKTLWYGGGWR